MDMTLRSLCFTGIVACFGLGYLPLGYALPEDRHQPLTAQAGSAEINQQSGISIYRQKVVAVQGSTSLNADKVVVKQDKNHQVQEVIAYGQPAVYKTTPEQGKAELTATALEIHYFPQQQVVELRQQATVVQNGNRYSAPYIHYNIARQTVASPAADNGRTTIVLQPSTFNHQAQAGS